MSSSGAEKSKDADDPQSPEEREAWLRARGVQIETAEDRAAAKRRSRPGDGSILEQLAALAAVVDDSSSGGDDDTGGVEFAFVPHDASSPFRSVRLPASFVVGESNAPGGGDLLPDFVKPYFASDRRSVDPSLLQQQATKHFAGGDLPTLDPSNISADAMNAVAARGSVETFPLVRPADTNGFTGVYVYLDEVGLLKKLPPNSRASSMASACGYDPPPTFYGDVFIGRVRTTQPGPMRNVDFVPGKDTDRGAEWMRRAVSENLAFQQDMNEMTGRHGETQPSAVGSEGKAAVESGFAWTQDDDELEVLVTLDEGVEKNAVKVTFQPRLLKVSHKGEEKLSFRLYERIDVGGCTWTIDGKDLILTMEKAAGGIMWPRIKETV